MDVTLFTRLLDMQTAWTLVTRYLDTADLVALYITALEHPETLHGVSHSIQYDIKEINVDSTMTHRRFMVHCAAAHGCLRAVKTLLRDYRSSRAKALHRHMAKFTPSRRNVQTKRMQWLNTFRPYLYPADVMYTVVRRGDVDFVEWLHSCCEYETHVAMVEAAKTGQLSLVEWLKAHEDTMVGHLFWPKSKWTETEIVVPRGPIGVIVWLEFHRRRSNDDRHRCVESEHFATSHGHYAKRYGKTPPAPFLSGPLYAAQHGDVSLMQRLHEDSQTPWKWSSNVVEVAIENGHLPILQWLQEYRLEEFTADAVYKAALNGRLDILKWFDSIQSLDSVKAQGLWSQKIADVVRRAHVEVVQWLYTHHRRLVPPENILLAYKHYGPPTNARRQFNLLQWLHNQDPQKFPVTDIIYRFAVNNHCSIEQIEWTRKRLADDVLNGISCDWTSGGRTFIHDDLELIQYLNRIKKVPLQEILELALHSRLRSIFHHYTEIWLLDAKLRDSHCVLLHLHDLAKACVFGSEDLVIDLIARSLVDVTAVNYMYYVPVLFGLQINLQERQLQRSRDFYTLFRRLVCACKLTYKDTLSESLFGDKRGVCSFTSSILRETKDGNALQHFVENVQYGVSNEVVAWSARYAHLHLLDYILGTLSHKADEWRRDHYSWVMILEACRHGHTSVLNLLTRAVQPDDQLWKKAALSAAECGQTGVLEWLRQNEASAQPSVLNDRPRRLWVAACRGDRVNVLQWLHAHSIVAADAKSQKYLIRVSMSRGHVSVVRWLVNVFHDVMAMDAQVRSEVAAFERRWSLGCW